MRWATSEDEFEVEDAEELPEPMKNMKMMMKSTMLTYLRLKKSKTK